MSLVEGRRKEKHRKYSISYDEDRSQDSVQKTTLKWCFCLIIYIIYIILHTWGYVIINCDQIKSPDDDYC